jgi:hypothetical protein
MAITIHRTPWIDDDGSGTSGTVLNNAMKTGLYDEIDGALGQAAAVGGVNTGDLKISGDYYEKSRTVPMGTWVDVPFSAANFGGLSGLTWTVAAGNVSLNHYRLIGKSFRWNLTITGSTIGGTPGPYLKLVAPTGVGFAKEGDGGARVQCADAAGPQGAFAYASPGNGGVIVLKDTGTYAAGALTLYLSMEFEIV